MNFLLVITLCLRLDATTAECRREVQGPYDVPRDCLERIKPTGLIIRAIGDDLNAGVLFVAVSCERGWIG